MEFCTSAKSCPNFQVFVGDQATYKTIRGAKRWVESEVNEVDKLKWAHEVPGMIQKQCILLNEASLNI